MLTKPPPPERIRLDKWLWAARFFKTRGLSAEEIAHGRVLVNGQPAKASREVRLGDRIEFKQAQVPRAVIVREASDRRGPATVAQGLYEETAESIERRERMATERRLGAEPALAIEQGRPTKRDRRTLVEWNRWSASAEPE